MTSHHGDSEAEATFKRATHPLRRVSALLLILEALLLGGAALYALVTLPAQAADLKTVAVGLTVFLGIFALMVGFAARSLMKRGRYGVSFGVTWQLFQALVGGSLIRGGLLWAGFGALALAAALFVLLLRPENRPNRELFVDDDT
ncbi:hypothetical protein DAD186_14940 [Dermabacter vaginalis]|uniref:Uncharacterized protein n=1 Tax=Dermabacter vaginalis TaxID=1630135 RepID=A0A1B0ZJ53_9MICO|nr:hypothetical protein [Dermabacter vaginalis]ANP28044.1 hypothetical protein DAD186_14940 [Dermabacter vaginalis]